VSSSRPPGRAAVRGGLTFRSMYAAAPAPRAALKALLRDVFGLDLESFDRLGLWEPAYAPFSYFDGDRVAANVSAFPIPLVVGGERVDAMGLQSGAVRPEYRGRGLYRDLMARALAYCDARAPTTLLYTAEPVLYVRFGFRAVPEYSFVGPPRAAGRAEATPRRLSLGDATDLALVRERLRGRTPVSARVGVVDHAAPFLLYALRTQEEQSTRLYYLADVDVVVVTQELLDGRGSGPTGVRLRVLDVVGRSIPPLAALLNGLGARPDRVEVCFPPDRLAWDGSPQPCAGRDVLMVRGPFAADGEPFMLPPTAAF
jgi:predicted N-acetyltransferase YhbS